MPYRLSEDGLCVEKATGETLKCYQTHEEALAYLKALEVNVMDKENTRLNEVIIITRGGAGSGRYPAGSGEDKEYQSGTQSGGRDLRTGKTYTQSVGIVKTASNYSSKTDMANSFQKACGGSLEKHPASEGGGITFRPAVELSEFKTMLLDSEEFDNIFENTWQSNSGLLVEIGKFNIGINSGPGK